MAAGETPGPSRTRPDRYFDDISTDELSANAPTDETNDDKNARRERNWKRNERHKCLRESLPIRNLAETLDQVANPRTVPHVYHYDSASGSGDTRG
jgi:hypothetical protein